MASQKIVFMAPTALVFPDATIATDGNMTVVLQGGERVFCIPTERLIGAERMDAQKATPPTPEPVPTPA